MIRFVILNISVSMTVHDSNPYNLEINILFPKNTLNTQLYAELKFFDGTFKYYVDIKLRSQ